MYTILSYTCVPWLMILSNITKGSLLVIDWLFIKYYVVIIIK